MTYTNYYGNVEEDLPDKAPDEFTRRERLSNFLFGWYKTMDSDDRLMFLMSTLAALSIIAALVVVQVFSERAGPRGIEMLEVKLEKQNQFFETCLAEGHEPATCKDALEAQGE